MPAPSMPQPSRNGTLQRDCWYGTDSVTLSPWRPQRHTGTVLLVFDGDCGFCQWSARWIGKRLPPEARVESWQSLDLDELGLSQSQVQAAAWWFGQCSDRSGHPHAINTIAPTRGHAAIGRALVAAGGVWGVAGRLALHPPTSWIARLAYTLISWNRHRLPGTGFACSTGPTVPDDCLNRR